MILYSYWKILIAAAVIPPAILLFVVPVITVMVVVTTKKSHPWFKKQQTQVDVLNQVLREKLSGIRVIRAFVRTDYEEKRYDSENEKMLKIAVHAHKLMTAMMPIGRRWGRK